MRVIDRQTRWILAAIAVAGVGLIAWKFRFLSPIGRTASATSAASHEGETAIAFSATGSVPEAALRSNGEASTDDLLLAQRAEILKQFSERLMTLDAVKAEIAKRQKALNNVHPNPYDVGEFGRQAVITALKRHQLYAERNRAFLNSPESTFGKFRQLHDDLLVPSELLAMANSTETVGDSTLGNIVRDLLERTEYADVLKEQLAAAAKKYLPVDTIGKSLTQTAGADAILSKLQLLAPALHQAYADTAANLSVPDAEFKAYVDDLSRAQLLETIGLAYKQSWTQDIEALSLKKAMIGGEMRALMEQFPVQSEERSRLAERLIQAFN